MECTDNWDNKDNKVGTDWSGVDSIGVVREMNAYPE